MHIKYHHGEKILATKGLYTSGERHNQDEWLGAVWDTVNLDITARLISHWDKLAQEVMVCQSPDAFLEMQCHQTPVTGFNRGATG